MVGMARLELATPRSQSECATNCATSRQRQEKNCFAINQCIDFLVVLQLLFQIFWGEWWGSNPRPPEPQSGALPTELHPP